MKQLDVEVSPPASVIPLNKYKWCVPKEHWVTFVCKGTLCSYLSIMHQSFLTINMFYTPEG